MGDAIYKLALMYEKGDGVSQDLSAARELYIQAQENYLQPDATIKVGQMYEKGDGVPQDDCKAVAFYSNKNHNNDFPDKYPNGFIEYGEANPEGVECVLRLWSLGRGFPNDTTMIGYKKPVDLIKSWSSLINTPAGCYYAGEICFDGKLVPKDMAQAADWFNKAATLGSPEAMNKIGGMWAAGMNGTPDSKEAADWYRRAAAKGLAEAQFNLGMSCAKGEGVSLDNVEAWKWLQLAAKQNYPMAAEERDKVQANLSADQLKQAQILTDQFIADKPL